MSKWYNNYNNAMKVAALGAYTARRYGSNSSVGAKTSNSTIVMARRRRNKRYGFNNRVKQVINRGLETKLNSSSESITAMTHASIYTTNLTAKIQQGTGDGQRIADAIDLMKVRMCFLVNAPSTSGAYSYRLLALYSGEEYNPVTWGTGGLVFAEIFLPNALINTGTISVTNPKAVTVVYDELIDVNSVVASTPDIYTHAVEFDISRKFPYQASGSVYGKKQNLYLVIIPYVVGGTAGTTACGNVIANWCVHYKDA